MGHETQLLNGSGHGVKGYTGLWAGQEGRGEGSEGDDGRTESER